MPFDTTLVGAAVCRPVDHRTRELIALVTVVEAAAAVSSDSRH